MKNRKVPVLRFGEFEGEWETKLLGEYFEFKNGINADKEQYGTGIKFINVSDILENDYLTYDRIQGSVDVSADQVQKNEVNYGDVLFQRSSETREEVGTANVYLDKDRSALFGGFVIRGSGKVVYSPELMNYLLKTSAVRKDITSRSGGSTRYNVGQDSLASSSFTLPTLPEQKKIATFLTAVDGRLAGLRRQRALLGGYKRGVMQKLFDTDATNTTVYSLASRYNVQMGQSPPSTSYNTEERGIYLIQGNADIEDNKTAPRYWTTEPTNLCNEGDVILSVRAPVGSVAKAVHHACIGRGVCRIYSDENSIEYIYQYLKWFEPRWDGIAQGSTFKAVSGSDIRKLNVPFPALPEQRRIATFLRALDDRIALVERQLAGAEAFKRGLLQGMFV